MVQAVHPWMGGKTGLLLWAVPPLMELLVKAVHPLVAGDSGSSIEGLVKVVHPLMAGKSWAEQARWSYSGGVPMAVGGSSC